MGLPNLIELPADPLHGKVEAPSASEGWEITISKEDEVVWANTSFADGTQPMLFFRCWDVAEQVAGEGGSGGMGGGPGRSDGGVGGWQS